MRPLARAAVLMAFFGACNGGGGAGTRTDGPGAGGSFGLDAGGGVVGDGGGSGGRGGGQADAPLDVADAVGTDARAGEAPAADASAGDRPPPDVAAADVRAPDAAPAVPCPQSAPTPGTACSGTMSCFYEVCSAGGRTSATCMAGAWRLETGPCAAVVCGPAGVRTCPAGTVCLVRAGGAAFADCVPNTCGTGPVSCDCIDCNNLPCYVGSTVREGVRIQCNTCPQGGCP